MSFDSDAIAYYTFHIISLPFSLFLFIFYRNHKYHSIIAYFALTLLLSSINSCYLAFVKNGNIKNTANTLPCDIQAFFISYLHSSIAIWLVCIESNMTLILIKRRRHQNGWSRRQILLSFMALAWGLPLFFTVAAFVLAVSEDGLKPWLYYCMFSEPAIGPAIGIYFVSLCAIIATIIMTAWNVKLVCDESEDIELAKRIIAFGVIVTLPICLATLARAFTVLINNNVDNMGMWPDYLFVTVPYFTFMIFGTRPELIKRFIPSSSPCQRNRGDSLLLRFSIINPTLRREIDEREQRLSLTLNTEKSSLEEQTSRPSTPGPSTFSQRTNPNAPDPFSHRKNPSLTINVPYNNNNRISKGKSRSSVSIRKSFLVRALTTNKESENVKRSSYISLTKSTDDDYISSRNIQKAMKAINISKKKFSSRRRGNRLSSTINKNRRSAFYFDTVDGRPRYLRTFSFENRKKAESVIGIPPEYINRLINKHLVNTPSIETNHNSADYEGSIEESEKERRERLERREQLLSRYPKPPPLALNQIKSPKSPSFFFLNPNHYDNDEYTDLPVTPSFGIASSSKAQNIESSSSSKSDNNSMKSSKSSHGGLRLTPRNSIPVHILNRKSLIDSFSKI